MSLFAAAAEKTASKAKTAKPKKNTTWTVGGTDEDAKVAIAVTELVKLKADMAASKAKTNVFKAVVMKHAKENHIRDFAALGVPPDTPMAVQNSDGDKVTFIVQDRSGQYKASDDQVAALGQILGDEAAGDLTFTETSLGFDRTIMAIPGVSEAIEKALESAIKRMIKAKTITEDHAGELIVAAQKKAFKPGTLERAAMICGNDTTKLTAFLDALGSSCTRYLL